MWRATAVLVGVLAVSAACSPAEDAATPGAASSASSSSASSGSGGSTQQPLAWGACPTKDWPDGYPLPVAGTECATIEVPYDHDHPDDGRTFPLRVARQRSKAFPTGEAIFQLAGGPGGTAVGQTGVMPKLFPKLLDRFDLVYVDQRGTGGSGYLDCPGGYPATESQWLACGKAHAGDDLAIYRTLVAADDLEACRVRLGYDKIDLRAGSYGTRLGLEYLRQHGENVRSAVLDGLVPPDTDFFGWLMIAFDRGVAMLSADCAASAQCSAIAPDVAADLGARRAALATSPRPILAGGQPTVEDETLFVEALEATLYDASLYYRVPRAIHAALAGDPSLWDGILGELIGEAVTEPMMAIVPLPAPRLSRGLPARGVDYVAPGVYEAIVCAEDLPNSQGIGGLEAAAATEIWPDTSGLDIAKGCAGWKVDPIAASLRAPVVSPARTLLLSGAIDLVTPPAWGDHAAETLANGKHLVIPESTHGTIFAPCAADIVTAFFEAGGDMSKVDTSCIAAMPPPVW